MERWRAAAEPRALGTLHRKPRDSSDEAAYAMPLDWPEKSEALGAKTRLSPPQIYERFVQLYFGKGKRPIIWIDNPEPEEVSWRLFHSLWPALRAQFAVCTHCLQPRTLDDRPFDLMFADSDVYPRFLKIDRENVIEGMAAEPGAIIDPWCKRWSERMFRSPQSDDVFDRDLFADLDDDPTAIRRLYLIDNALQSITDAPQAAVGAMDLVESVARPSSVAIRTKSEVARRAVTVARDAKSPQDSIECLQLIEDRLKRPAYGSVAADIGQLVEDAVSKRTQSDPDTVANLPPGSYEVNSTDNPAWFFNGVVRGFRQLAKDKDLGLAALRLIPHVSSVLFSTEPSASRAFREALIVRRNEPDIRRSIRDMFSASSKEAGLLRSQLFKSFCEEDLELLDNMLTGIKEDQVSEALDALTPFLANREVRRTLDQTLVRGFPEEVRKWALKSLNWSDALASIAATTYPPSQAGLTELLAEEKAKERLPSILVHYLNPQSRGRFPAWLRRFVSENEVVLALLLKASQADLDGVDELVSRLLSECEDLRPAHSSLLLQSFSQYAKHAYYPTLLDLLFSDLLKGYLDGTVSEDKCLPILQGAEMVSWLGAMDYSPLISLLTHQVWNRRDNWLNAWRLLLLLPTSVYQRTPSLIVYAIDSLLRAYYQAWSPSVAHTWSNILQRTRVESPASHLTLQVQAFRYAIYNARYPLSQIVVETFKDIYYAVTESSALPPETAVLFGMWDWDKGKELRKTLIDTYIGSQWPSGDLALAAKERTLFRKIFKRIHRKSSGPKYLRDMLADLSARLTPEATQMANTLSTLLRDPDFYEDWD
jgi:hypothetical protein